MVLKIRKLTQSPIFHICLLFFLALSIRLPYLGTYLTIDEVKWMEGARQFAVTLFDGDLAQTYWHFFPGVTITWGEVLILWLRWLAVGKGSTLSEFVATQFADLDSLIGQMRLPAVFMTSLIIPGVYILARRLVGTTIALLGSILLIFNPFFLAHSRIVNGDASAAGFMLLSVLAFLWLWQGSELRLAALSGAMGGLAMLTKLPAPIIIPWVGVLALIGYWQQRSISFWIRALAVWGLTAAGVFFLFWPAMWVAPLDTLQRMYQDSFGVGEVGAGHSTFFLQQISDDPGWRFYPVTIAFRLTPLTTIGLLLAILWLVLKAEEKTVMTRRIGWSLVAYILFVILIANLSPKKSDRYVMAVFPALDLLIAIGLWGIWHKLAKTRSRSLRTTALMVLALVGIQQGLLIFVNYPYLLTSYNPLLGGYSKAASTIPVGWGEGIEQAARYLNNLPEAETLAVSSWYSDIFHPYSISQRASFSDDGRAQLAADYVVFYINQIQRQKPYSGLVDYFRADDPVFVVAAESPEQVTSFLSSQERRKSDIHWVEVYKAPAAQSASGAPRVEGVAQLLAYKVSGGRLADDDPESEASIDSAENDLSITLFFRVLGPLPPGATIVVSLTPIFTAESPRWDEWQLTETSGEWLYGRIIEWHGELTFPPDIPSDLYRLRAALQSEDGAIIAEFPVSREDPPINIQ